MFKTEVLHLLEISQVYTNVGCGTLLLPLLLSLSYEITLLTKLGTWYFQGRWRKRGQIGKVRSGSSTSFFCSMATWFQILLKEFW